LAVPFVIRKEEEEEEEEEAIQSTTNSDKIPAHLVLFEPVERSSRKPSCQTIYQRMHHRPREDWDKSEAPFFGYHFKRGEHY
jgi:hypothetical protein